MSFDLGNFLLQLSAALLAAWFGMSIRRAVYWNRIRNFVKAKSASTEVIQATRQSASTPGWLRHLPRLPEGGQRLRAQSYLDGRGFQLPVRNALLLILGLGYGVILTAPFEFWDYPELGWVVRTWGLPLLLASAGYGLWFARWLRRNRLLVVLTDHPLTPGQSTSCQIRWPGGPPGDRLSVALIERFRIRNPAPTWTWPRWQMKLLRHCNFSTESRVTDAPTVELSVIVTIPADALPSCEGEDVQWQWGIEVAAPTRRQRQYREFFPLYVRQPTIPVPSIEDFIQIAQGPDSLRT